MTVSPQAAQFAIPHANRLRFHGNLLSLTLKQCSKEADAKGLPTGVQSMLVGQSELVELLTQVRDLLATKDIRVIELNTVDDSAIQITLLLDEQHTGILRFPLSAEAIEEFAEFFSSRVAPWPELTGALGLCRNPASRLLFAPTTGQRSICSVEIMSENGKPLVQFRDISNSDVLSVQELVKDEVLYSAELAEVLNSPAGLVIANHCDKGIALDASRICAAARPDALLVRAPDGLEALRELLTAAEERLVILMSPRTDPVEMLVAVKRLCGADRDLEHQAAKVLLAAWATFAIRKSCARCSRPTPSPPGFLERIPDSLGHLIKNSYLFGRGCDDCDFSAYQGHTLISSWLRFHSRTKLGFLDFGAAAALYRIALENGTRALFEDGVRKIFDGNTSFEEVFSIVSEMPLPMEASRPGTLPSRPVVAAATKENHSPNVSAVTPKILLVEDNIIQRQVIRAFLQQARYEVITTEDGMTALTLLESRTFDLIVCDVMMPLMNGIDFVKQLRASGHRDIPILVFTAVHDPKVEFELLDAGADDYCEKTVKKGILLKRVEKLIRRGASQLSGLEKP